MDDWMSPEEQKEYDAWLMQQDRDTQTEDNY